MDRARAIGAVPKLFYVNNSSEYWNRAASLIATDPAGLRDLKPAPEARIYLIAGAQHYVGNLRDRGIFANCVNTLNHYRVMRALMLAFDRWVRDGVEPPPSTYPRIADGTLVTLAAHAQAFPRIPDFHLPEGNLRPPRLNLGSRFEIDRIADEVPPSMGKPFETLVPKPDTDGLDQGGRNQHLQRRLLFLLPVSGLRRRQLLSPRPPRHAGPQPRRAGPPLRAPRRSSFIRRAGAMVPKCSVGTDPKSGPKRTI